MKIKVSIVIPIYNHAKTLKRAILSCINQTYKNIEIILINDGSTDETGKICENAVRKEPRVKYYVKGNGGVSDARNFGIEHASGDYISFLDADDSLRKDAIENMLKEIEDIDFLPDLIVGGYVKRDGKTGKTIEKCLIEHKLITVDIPKVLLNDKQLLVYKSACAKLYKFSIIKEKGIRFEEDVTFGEDAFFNLKFLEYTQSIVQINKYMYNYYEKNTLEKVKRYKMDDVENMWHLSEVLYNKRVRLFKRTNCYEKYQHKVDILYLERIRFFLNMTISNKASRKEVTKKLEQIPFESDIIFSNIKMDEVQNIQDKIVLLGILIKSKEFLYNCFKCKVWVGEKLKEYIANKS